MRKWSPVNKFYAVMNGKAAYRLMPPSRKHDSAVLLNRPQPSLETSAYASFPDVDAAVGFQDEDALIVVGEDGGERGNVVREVGAVSQIVEPFP